MRIPKGDYVAVFLGSANRDERRFPNPDRLDLDRDLQGFPGFGFGKHFCLGASLARLETRIAFEALVPELLRLERAEGRGRARRLVPGARPEAARVAAGGLAMTLEFDPLAAHADPYPIYRRLRDEAPVHFNPGRRVWSVTRFDDVMHVLKTPEVFSSRAMFTMVMAGGNERLPLLTLAKCSGSCGAWSGRRAEPARVLDLAQPDRRGRRAPLLDARDREPRLHAAPDRRLGAARA